MNFNQYCLAVKRWQRMAKTEKMLEFCIMAATDALIVFAKRPDPQHTKLRLTPPLRREEAATLYGCFLADVLDVSRQVQNIALYIFYDPPEAGVYFASLAPDFRAIAQTGHDLGGRMNRAFTALFTEGYQRIVLIGSDLPHLSTQTIKQSFRVLRQGAQVVLGPSADGGYYLVGLIQPYPKIFDLPMSTPLVLQQTLERVRSLGLRSVLLEESFDIDTAADLAKLEALLQSDPAIPALHTRSWLANQPANLFKPG